MISLIYSAGLRRSELLNLTPQDIVSERMLVRIMGKGKKCRYSLLSEKVLHELREYFKTTKATINQQFTAERQKQRK